MDPGCGPAVGAGQGARPAEGSLSDSRSAEKHIAIVTYWKSFDEHERSHADKAFKDKFAALAKLCVESKELGYDMLWQGALE